MTPSTPSEDELDKILELLYERGRTDQYIEATNKPKAVDRKDKVILEAKSALQAIIERERRRATLDEARHIRRLPHDSDGFFEEIVGDRIAQLESEQSNDKS